MNHIENKMKLVNTDEFKKHEEKAKQDFLRNVSFQDYLKTRKTTADGEKFVVTYNNRVIEMTIEADTLANSTDTLKIYKDCYTGSAQTYAFGKARERMENKNDCFISGNSRNC